MGRLDGLQGIRASGQMNEKNDCLGENAKWKGELEVVGVVNVFGMDWYSRGSTEVGEALDIYDLSEAVATQLN